MTTPIDDDALESTYLSDDRSGPHLAVNMVQTLDGGTAIDGRSTDIGDRQDRVVFRALRASVDLILVGGETARAERYGTPQLPEHLRRWRRDRGLAGVPEVAIVSGSLEVDVARFGDDGPIVVTGANPPRDRLASFDPDRVIRTDSDDVDVASAVAQLRGRGHRSILCEGGPSLNAQMASADLVDEWCVTVASRVVGGDSSRIVSGVSLDRRYRLDRVMRGETSVFLRWLRPPSGDDPSAPDEASAAP